MISNARKTIKAHARLWDFLQDIQPYVLPITKDDPEPLLELFGATVEVMHPAYQFKYIHDIFPLALDAMGLLTPDVKDLLMQQKIKNKLGDVYARICEGRIKI